MWINSVVQNRNLFAMQNPADRSQINNLQFSCLISLTTRFEWFSSPTCYRTTCIQWIGLQHRWYNKDWFHAIRSQCTSLGWQYQRCYRKVLPQDYPTKPRRIQFWTWFYTNLVLILYGIRRIRVRTTCLACCEKDRTEIPAEPRY